MKIKILLLIAVIILFASCAKAQEPPAVEKEPEQVSQQQETPIQQTEEEAVNMKTHQTIKPEEAKKMMDETEGYIILDVREQSEYDQGHIENAIIIPVGEIAARAETELPDKDQTIMVYCRSGKRSEAAADMLDSLGYQNVYDFGGIMNWPYETVQ